MAESCAIVVDVQSEYAMLETNVGYMEGSYHMLSEDGELFHAPIAPFTLAVPGSLN